MKVSEQDIYVVSKYPPQKNINYKEKSSDFTVESLYGCNFKQEGKVHITNNRPHYHPPPDMPWDKLNTASMTSSQPKVPSLNLIMGT